MFIFIFFTPQLPAFSLNNKFFSFSRSLWCSFPIFTVAQIEKTDWISNVVFKCCIWSVMHLWLLTIYWIVMSIRSMVKPRNCIFWLQQDWNLQPLSSSNEPKWLRSKELLDIQARIKEFLDIQTRSSLIFKVWIHSETHTWHDKNIHCIFWVGFKIDLSEGIATYRSINVFLTF